MDFADKTLPNVPSEEARYLEAESGAALRMAQEEANNNDEIHVLSNERFLALQGRPLHPVWEFRLAIGPTRLALERVLKTSPGPLIYRNPEAEKLRRALDASEQVAAYSRALERLTERIENKSSIMTAGQYQTLVMQETLIPLYMHSFMRCKLAKVMGPQSLPK